MENVDVALKNALSPFGLDLESSIYQGEAKKYISYNYTTVPIDFGDDAPARERYLVQVHIVAPYGENINSLVREIKAALFASDFSWPEYIDASDRDRRHIVLETEAVTEL